MRDREGRENEKEEEESEREGERVRIEGEEYRKRGDSMLVNKGERFVAMGSQIKSLSCVHIKFRSSVRLSGDVPL